MSKQVSFEIAKVLKDAGYPQGNENTAYYNELGMLVKPNVYCGGKEIADAPTYIEVWLWLWRDKGIRCDIEDLWNAELSYPERGCASNTNQLGGICTPEVSDPEDAIVNIIDYLVENNLIK